MKRLAAHRQTWLSSGGINMTPASRLRFERDRTDFERRADYRWLDHQGESPLSAVLFDLVAKENARARAISEHVGVDNGLAEAVARQSESPFKALNSLLRLGSLTVSLHNQDDAEIVAEQPGGYRFPFPSMSDGERSATMIAAMVLTADAGTTFLVDEPERHLHRAIITPFLSALFSQRPDCSFVISTHEISLPLASPDAQTLIVRSHDWTANTWDAELLAANLPLPEPLRIAVLGGRQQLLFVEGDSRSLDTSMYEALFPGVAIISKGGCADVQRAVEGLRNVEDQHHVHAYGLIDRDNRSDDEVGELQQRGIFALNVRTVESLYYCSHAIHAVSVVQGENVGEDSVGMAKAAKNACLERLSHAGTPRRMVARRCEATVRRLLLQQAPSWQSILCDDGSTVQIEVSNPFEDELDHYKQLLAGGEIDSLVALYPFRETGACDHVARALQCRDRGIYERMVVTLVRKNSDLRNALLSKLGPLATEIAPEHRPVTDS